MTLDSLSELEDDGLRAVIGRAEELLAQHDRGRKEKAMEQARATLAAVGLTMKDLVKAKTKANKTPQYRGGHVYQHPTNKTLVWAAKGKKPKWLIELEGAGAMAVELSSDSINTTSIGASGSNKVVNA